MSNSSYRRENNLAQTVIMFVIFLAMFLGGIYAMSYWSLENAFVPGITAFALIFLSLVIPMTWIGRSNSAGE